MHGQNPKTSVYLNMEMQNDSNSDSLSKRSRFYQGLIDTPILKSGKHTKYQQLPSTIIIFITQEDIFNRDLAKYTFIEQCQELSDLYLNDGTKKIFLNMSSKNGSKELVSLLQYMKETTLNNPNILVKDKRIIELNDIVEEVKQSEEWEAVQMNILEIGIQKGLEQGIEQGMEQGIAALISTCQEFHLTKDETRAKICEKFNIRPEKATDYLSLYWK